MSVTLTPQGDVALITMDDGKANAVNPTLVEGLHRALDTAEAEFKAVILAGRPGRFSAGFDLKVLQGGSADDALALVHQGGTLLHRLYGFPLPLVAACTGHGIALGAFMLLASDLRLGVAGDFKIGANETPIGMALPVFGLELAHARLDPRALTRSIVQGHLFDPAGAAEVGFLDRVVAPEALMAEAGQAAADLATLPGHAYAANKRGIRDATLTAIQASL